MAAEYVRLARMENAHDANYLEAVRQLRTGVADLPPDEARRVFLLDQLAALERRARFLAGERTTIRDDAAALGMTVPAYDAARAVRLRADLETALPGRGTLLERLAAHRREHAVPRSGLERITTQAVEECRKRTPPLERIADGGVELRYVVDTPWPAFTTNRGNGKSVIELRRDVAWLEDDLLSVVCHETYPGHHVQNLVWDDLRASRGWEELAVTPMFTPHAVMAERAANAATALIVPSTERPPVSRALEEFAPLALATAVEIVDGQLDRSSGLARLRDDLLMPDPDGFVAFVEKYRVMAVAYVTPLPKLRDWNDYLALLRSPERLVGSGPR